MREKGTRERERKRVEEREKKGWEREKGTGAREMQQCEYLREEKETHGMKSTHLCVLLCV